MFKCHSALDAESTHKIKENLDSRFHGNDK